MERPEIIQLLRVGHDEIIRLRRQVADLEPRAHAYDTIAQIARLSVQHQSQGYGEDPAWRLKDAVEKLIAQSEGEE